MANHLRTRLRSRLETRARSRENVRALVPLTRFLRLSQIAGWPLLAAAVIALIWANIPGGRYEAIWEQELSLGLGSVARTEPLGRWVTDLLLPLFFLVAGLEIKRELVHGELAGWRRASLPLSIALGGMLGPVACYVAMTWNRAGVEGWAVPVATDIAFALAVLGVLGDRVPRSVKVLTLAFAAIDDVGGALIIAVFYSGHINSSALAVGAGFLSAIVICRFISVRGELIYWLLGAGFVASVLHGGIHSTVAGLVLGLLAPSSPLFSREDLVARLAKVGSELEQIEEQLGQLEHGGELDGTDSRAHDELVERQNALLGELEELTAGYESPIERELRRVTPWVSYLILPCFALANAGVPISVATLTSAIEPGGPGLAIIVSLVVAKPLGFLLFAWLALATGLAKLPDGVGWRHLLVVGLLAGIGLTISVFIAQLAFPTGELLDTAKLAVLVASMVASLLGAGAGFTLLERRP